MKFHENIRSEKLSISKENSFISKIIELSKSKKQSIRRDREQSKESKNKVILIFENVFLINKKQIDLKLAYQMRKNDQIIISNKLFEQSNKMKINILIDRDDFEFESFDSIKHESIRIFKFRLVRKMKDKTITSYEKLRLVIQNYQNDEKQTILIQSSTIQRASQRLIVVLTPSLLINQMNL